MPTKQSTPASPPRPLDPGTLSAPERILDAAEAIFASRGYHGATIRDITDAAGVPLSLARYHFGSKDQLYQQVLGRRAEETCQQLEASLQHALTIAPSEGRLEAVVDAMVSLSVERLAGGDPGWRNYLWLLSQLNQLTGRPELLKPFRDRYIGTLGRYRAALRAILPQAERATIDWSLHFLQILVGHAMLDLVVTGMLDGREAATVDWSQLRCHLVAHVVGGIRAQLALGAGGRRARRASSSAHSSHLEPEHHIPA